MSDLHAYLEAELVDALHRRIRERYWCPRCDTDALPTDWAPDGWCPICGLDPRLEGPRKPLTAPQGILAIATNRPEVDG